MLTDLPSSGVRPDPCYGNPLDQLRYIYVLDAAANKDILDLASGVGWGSFLLSSAGAKTVIGVDLSSSAINFSANFYAHPALTFIHGTTSNILKLSRKYDLITSFETIEHVEDPEQFLIDLKSVSHSETRLYLSTPNSVLFGSQHTKPANPFHVKEFTRAELTTLILDAGWEIEKYLGQYPVKNTSLEVKQYRQFIFQYWRNKLLRNKVGMLFSIFNKIRALLYGTSNDPAWNSPHIQEIQDGFEPAYHYMILTPSRL